MPWRYGIVKYRHKKDRDFRFYGIAFPLEDPFFVKGTRWDIVDDE